MSTKDDHPARLDAAAAFLLTLLGGAAALSVVILADASRSGILLGAAGGGVLGGLMIVAWQAERQPSLVFGLILTWLLFQNVILTPLSKVVSPLTIRLLLGAKEVFFLLVILAFLPRFLGRLAKYGGGKISLLWSDLIALPFFIVMALDFFLGGSFPLVSRVTYLRFYAILPICYLVGRLLPLDRRGLKTVSRVAVIAAVCLVLFGLVEMTLLGDGFWMQSGIAEFHSAKGTEAWLTASTKFSNWYTWDFGVPWRRMISWILEPTTLSEFIALGTLLAAFGGLFRRIKREAAVFILLMGLALTFGKGGWVIFMVGTLILLWKERPRLAAAVGGFFVVFGLLFLYYNIRLGGSVIIHLRGFLEGLGFALRHPLGIGLGGSGVYAALLGQKSLFLGKESTIGSMLIQTGFIGVLLYLAFFLAMLVQLARLARSEAGIPDSPGLGDLARSIGGGLAGILLVTFFSESAVGVLGTGIFLVLAGAVQRFHPPQIEVSA